MKKIFLLISLVFILSACTDSEDLKKIEELENKIDILNTQIENNNLKEKEFIFNKNRECEILIKNLNITSNYSELNLSESIYSKKDNECFYIVTSTNDYEPEIFKIEKLYKLSIDYNNSPYIEECKIIIGEVSDIYRTTIKMNCDQFNKKLKELKK